MLDLFIDFGIYLISLGFYSLIGLLCMFFFSTGESLLECFKIWLFWPYYYIKNIILLVYEFIQDEWKDYKKRKEGK